MDENDFYEELKRYALGNDNYAAWREKHAEVFGALFEDAFSQNEEAKIALTAALINISKRNFELAMPTLDILEKICTTESDETAICYFKGLNHEMLGNEDVMERYYDRIKNASVMPKFALPFHPYYRTAKFAQRDSECTKAMYYYRKALEFYDGITPDPHVASVASHIIYDIATLCLYMHEYNGCEHFLEISYQYDKSKNEQRDYVKAILSAVRNKKDKCIKILETMSPLLKTNCKMMTDAIFKGCDPHYCIVSQNRSLYGDFWSFFLQDETKVKSMIINGDIDKAQQIVSQKLTEVFAFMKRTLDCRIEKSNENVVVSCKNYWVKSLIAEHAALFAIKPEKLFRWNFVSVTDFEQF